MLEVEATAETIWLVSTGHSVEGVRVHYRERKPRAPWRRFLVVPEKGQTVSDILSLAPSLADAHHRGATRFTP